MTTKTPNRKESTRSMAMKYRTLRGNLTLTPFEAKMLKAWELELIKRGYFKRHPSFKPLFYKRSNDANATT